MNSGSFQDMMHVANSCPGYKAKGEGFISSIGEKNSKSCMNCEFLKNNKCEKNLYDSVLTSLDQT